MAGLIKPAFFLPCTFLRCPLRKESAMMLNRNRQPLSGYKSGADELNRPLTKKRAKFFPYLEGTKNL